MRELHMRELHMRELDMRELDMCELDMCELDMCEREMCEREMCEREMCERDMYGRREARAPSKNERARWASAHAHHETISAFGKPFAMRSNSVTGALRERPEFEFGAASPPKIA